LAVSIQAAFLANRRNSFADTLFNEKGQSFFSIFAKNTSDEMVQKP